MIAQVDHAQVAKNPRNVPTKALELEATGRPPARQTIVIDNIAERLDYLKRCGKQISAGFGEAPGRIAESAELSPETPAKSRKTTGQKLANP
jgi:hypothetical protein